MNSQEVFVMDEILERNNSIDLRLGFNGTVDNLPEVDIEEEFWTVQKCILKQNNNENSWTFLLALMTTFQHTNNSWHCS